MQKSCQNRIDVNFEVGEEVLLSTKYLRMSKEVRPRKFKPRWAGPFKVKRRVNAVVYELELPPDTKVHNKFHVSLLKKFVTSPLQPAKPPPEPEIFDGNLYHSVDKLLAHRRTKKGKYQYYVKWEGYAEHESTWEPEEHISPETLREYWTK